MLFFAPLLIVVLVGGSYGDLDCMVKERECDAAVGLPPRAPPENAEELLRACRWLIEYGSCTADAKESCDPDDKEIPTIRQAVDYLTEVCHEDNRIFEAISSNLDCVRKVSETLTASCVNTFAKSTIDSMIQHLQPALENANQEVLQCLDSLLMSGCHVMKFTHSCGPVVGEAIADVLANVNSDECTPEALEELTPLLQGLGDIVEEEMALWDKKRK